MSLGSIFVWGLTAAGTLYGWVNPFFGLMVYYIFAILRPTYLWRWAFDQADPPRFSMAVAAAVLLGWGLVGFGDWKGVSRVSLPLLGLGLYIGSGLVATMAFAVNQVVAWQFLENQIKVGLMALVTVTLVRSDFRVRAFAWLTLVTLGYLAFNFNVEYREAPLRLWRNGFGGIDNNGTAMIMVTGVAMAIFMGMQTRRLLVKAMCVLIALMLMHVIMFSYSRGGQLGLAIVSVTSFLLAISLLPRKGWTLVIGVVCLLAAAALAGQEVRERFWTIFADAQERDASAASRFDTWTAALRCIKENPGGVGPRNFNLVSHLYGLPRNKSVHNLFLQAGADYGVAGMAGLALFYISSIWIAFRSARTAMAKLLGWPRYYGYMVAIALVGFVSCSMFIGMETVEVAYIVGLLGLCTAMHVHREEIARLAQHAILPEMEQVPAPERAGLMPA